MALTTIKSGRGKTSPVAEDKTKEPETPPTVPTEPTDPTDPVDDDEDEDVKAKKEKAMAMDERARIKAIMSSEEANGREDTARHLAFETDMAPEAAIGILKTVAVKAAATTTTPAPQGASKLDEAMARSAPNPKIEARQGGNEPDGEDKEMAEFRALAVDYGYAAKA